MKCEKCGIDMSKIGRMESGNSVFIEYQCSGCGKKNMKAEGIA